MYSKIWLCEYRLWRKGSLGRHSHVVECEDEGQGYECPVGEELNLPALRGEDCHDSWGHHSRESASSFKGCSFLKGEANSAEKKKRNQRRLHN